MKKIILILIFLLTINLALAQEDYRIYQNINIDFLLDTTIGLEGSGNLNTLTSTIHLYPKQDENQDIIQLNEFSTPPAEITKNEHLIFEWTEKNPTYNFGYNTEIKTKNKIYKVPEIYFPYEELENGYQNYLQSEETIDITPEIIEKTSEIIGNENNAYLAVHKIAKWINKNIEYDLNTLTEKAAQKASWTLEHEYGVCDEISILFVSMTRSMGIPARYVSGIAYTNLNNNFGNHGWAEVYYPNYGWVPYDITYGQFGWIDPTHISLQKTKDVESSLSYQWYSSGDISVNTTGDIITSAEIKELGNELEPIFDISIKALEREVAPGSFVPIKIKIKNPYNKYISNQITITTAPGLTEDNSKQIALKPKEQKEIFWIVEIPEDIEKNYMYTSTIETIDLFGSKDSTTISFAENYEKVTLEEAEEMVNSLSPEEEDKYSNQIVLNCNPTKDYFYSFEEKKINCIIRTFNNNIDGLSLCIKDICEEFNMNKNQEKEIEFNINTTEMFNILTLKNQDFEIKRSVLLTLIEKPELIVSQLNLTEVDYNEELEIPITIYSETPITNIVLNVNRFNSLTFEELYKDQTFSLKFNTKGLNSEKIKIDISFKDEYNNTYTQQYTQEIKVNNLPWYWKLINLFRK
tara:strand:- start:358 stop:2262 length:1905 start_codon:yes stop_codon:yes gene_type:complete